MSKLILVCGCSGAGKSTLAERLARKFGYKHLDVDNFYKIPGETGRRDKFDAWTTLFQAIRGLEIAGIDCIVDSAALNMTSRDEFVNWFPSFEHHMVYVDAELELRLGNNARRERYVPADVMISQSTRVEPPVWRTMDKAWLSYTRIHNSNNKYFIIQKEGDVFYESDEEVVG